MAAAGNDEAPGGHLFAPRLSRGFLLFDAFWAPDPPCEAWRPMATPTDEARSREGRVAGFGRGPLALPLDPLRESRRPRAMGL